MCTRHYPRIWSRFERNFEHGKALKFEIGDIPESMWNTAVEFMLGSYIREDEWWKTAGAANDLQALEECRALLTSIIRQKLSLACFLAEGDGMGHTLVGINLCLTQAKDKNFVHKPPKSKSALLCLRMFQEAMKVTVIYDKFGVKDYLMGVGLSVAPQYRCLGIAVELLKSRINLAKSAAFQATGGIFTSTFVQRSAEKAGMDCLYQITYKEFGKKCGIKFKTETEFLKIYGCSFK